MYLRDFLRPVSTVLFSGAFAQALNIVSVLILTKSLSVDGFGEYSVFISYVSIFIAISLLSYDKAIPNLQDSDLYSFIIGMVLVLVCYTLFSLALFWMLDYRYAVYVVAYILVASALKMLLMMAIRSKLFSIVAYMQSLPSIFFTIFTAFFYFFSLLTVERSVALYCISHAIPLVFFHRTIKIVSPNDRKYSCRSVARVLKEERSFAIFTSPSEVFNRLAYYLPTLIIERAFGPAFSGYYGLMLRVCFAPISLITRSIGLVFQSFLASSVRENGVQSKILTNRFYLNAALVFVAIASVVFFILPELVLLVFGLEWAETSLYIKIMTPVFALMSIATPLATAFHVHKKNKEILIQQFNYFLISFISFAVAVLVDSMLVGISVFSFLSSLRYLHMIYVMHRFV